MWGKLAGARGAVPARRSCLRKGPPPLPVSSELPLFRDRGCCRVIGGAARIGRKPLYLVLFDPFHGMRKSVSGPICLDRMDDDDADVPLLNFR